MPKSLPAPIFMAAFAIVAAACSSAVGSIAPAASPTSAPPSTAASAAAPSLPPPSASAGSESTYAGTWTLTYYANDSDFDEPQFAVGDSVPGTLHLDCTASEGFCNMDATRDGTEWFAVSGEEIGLGQLRRVLEETLNNCQNGQIRRSSYEVTFGPAEATATHAQITTPRTCEDGGGTLYATDETWSFQGTLTDS